MENLLKKLTKALNTLSRVIIAVGAIMPTGEFLIMSLIKSLHTITLKDGVLKNRLFKVIEPIAPAHQDRFPRLLYADLQADEC